MKKIVSLVFLALLLPAAASAHDYGKSSYYKWSGPAYSHCRYQGYAYCYPPHRRSYKYGYSHHRDPQPLVEATIYATGGIVTGVVCGVFGGCRQHYVDPYSQGLRDGYEAGRWEGEQQRYRDGFNRGVQEGYDDGRY